MLIIYTYQQAQRKGDMKLFAAITGEAEAIRAQPKSIARLKQRWHKM
jgi:hypothetical protein